MRIDEDKTLLMSTNNYITQLIRQSSESVNELKWDLRNFIDDEFVLASTTFNVSSMSADREEVRTDDSDDVKLCYLRFT